MTIITDWTAEKAARMTRANLAFQHSLHERPMFDDAGLISLLDRYPREKLGVFTMGEDPVDWGSWRRGSPGDLSGEQLLRAAQEGRIWLNLRHANDYLPEYAALEEEIFAEKRDKAGLRTFKRDLGMLISSANAQVFYHLDVPLVSLWQLRGQKRVWVYPVAEPCVGAEQLERIVLRETAEQMAFEPSMDAVAEVYDLTPGKMVTWAQNAPHRIVNGPMLNVSLSIEFMTPAALMRANVLYANGMLRKSGARPRIQTAPHPKALVKIAFARAAKAAGVSKTFERTLPETFRLEA
ncbi:hypothetical protein [Brevundimonas sp.]|uniref:hypothetical protein n=1 Tax=Brevundimonas sp. TaxID=1871086 RepID=UPI00403340E2